MTSSGAEFGKCTDRMRCPGVCPGALRIRTAPSPKTSRSSSDDCTFACSSGRIRDSKTPTGVGFARAHERSDDATMNVAWKQADVAGVICVQVEQSDILDVVWFEADRCKLRCERSSYREAPANASRHEARRRCDRPGPCPTTSTSRRGGSDSTGRRAFRAFLRSHPCRKRRPCSRTRDDRHRGRRIEFRSSR